MALAFFYIREFDGSKNEIELDEETSRHVVQVLRMKIGERMHLTDGKGNLFTAQITDEHKKHCRVGIVASQFTNRHPGQTTIGISLLKNPSRFEWFLEKTTEIGVMEIIPLLCERTEKEKFRYDRMEGICISAMLQSQQVWLPKLHEPVDFKKIVGQISTEQRFIGYCDDKTERIQLFAISNLNSSTIFIGPEGDFTLGEIELAISHKFQPVSLGNTRLRSETAGIVAATLLTR